MTVQPRGIIAARAEGQPSDTAGLISNLSEAFKQFKDRYDARVDGLEARMNRMRLAGVGSGGDGLGGARASEVRNALLAFGAKGDLAPMNVLSVDSDPDGGYLVVPELADTINRTAVEISPMRDLARVVEVGSSSWVEPIAEDLPDAEWVGERQSRAETDHGQLNEIEIVVNELMAQPSVTQKLLDDASFDVAAFLEREIALKFAQAEATAFIDGDGVLKPRGFLAYDAVTTDDETRAFGKLQYVASGAASDITDVDALINVVSKLKTGYRAGAVWLMNRATVARLRKLKDSDNRSLIAPDLQRADQERLLGFPIRQAEDMPAIASGSFPIAFGNFNRGYTIVDRLGIRLLRDNLTTKGRVKFYTTKRVGGGLVDSNAIKLLKIEA